MKRIVIRVLAMLCLSALMLALSPAQAVGGSEIDLVEKLRMQPKASGYSGSGEIRASGESMAFPFDGAFSLLKTLDGYTLTVAGTGFSRDKRIKVNDGYVKQPVWETDTLVTLAREEKVLPELRVYTDNDTFAFSSPVFEGKIPAFGRGALLRALENTGLADRDAVLIYRLVTLFADSAPALEPYVSDLGMRLSAFCDHTEDASGTRLTYRVPAAVMMKSLADEVSAMLEDKNVRPLIDPFAAGEAEALPALLGRVTPSDDFEITRVYDRQAVMQETEMYIPFTGENGYSACRIRLTPGEAGLHTEITLSGDKGEAAFSFEKTGQNAWRGSFGTADAEGVSRAFDWQAEYSIGAVSYDRVKDLAVQELRARVSVSADGKTQTASAMVLLSSGAKATAPLTLELTAGLESENGARAELTFTGNTFRRTEPGTPDENSMIFLDRTDENTARETLETVKKLWDALGKQ